ncbi:MAG: hypothetical protein SGJ05_07830 [bacterium]|nr:hypothetical protein [bacterium]
MSRALIALFSSALFVSASAQGRVVDERRSTIERMNVMLQESLARIVQQVPTDSISVRVIAHPDAEIIRMMTVNALGTRTVLAGTSAKADLVITPVDVSTRYETTDAVDSVDRVVTVSLQAVMNTYGQERSLRSEKIVERERLHRNDALRLQSGQRSSTTAQIPPVPSTLWDDILQPAIFVAAAVTTVVLLFTVRSQ